MRLGSGAYEGAFSFKTRFEEEPGTNPEELVGAAHAGCFSMFLSGVLSKVEHPPTSIDTDATVHLEKEDAGWRITRIELRTRGVVPGIDEAAFREHAQTAKENCPVSKALAGVDVSVDATLAAS
jgi:osmotically inducible protein OsmC